MDNGRKSIDEIFAGKKVFRIPDYQRGYAWEDKQINDFFEDFKSYYASRSYYYGTLLLQEVDENNGKNQFEIVDGQQRITTLVIFISCLIQKLRKNPECDQDELNDLYKSFIKNKDVYILNLQSQDNDFFTSCILDGKDVVEAKTPSQRRLLNAKRKFDELLDNCGNCINDFKDKICSANVLVYLVNNRTEASMIFETTNDRGKSLTNLEKTKSFLMYKACVAFEYPDQILEKIQTRFNEIYRDFETIENKFLDENSILQYNFIAYENWNNENKVKEYQHYMDSLKCKIEKLLLSSTEELQKYIDDYTFNVQQSYNAVSKMLLKPVKEFNDILALGRTASFYPLLIKSYREDRTIDKENYRKVCNLCEMFSFRVLAILKYASNKYQTKWFELAKEFDGNFDNLFTRMAKLIMEIDTNEKFITYLSASDFFDAYSSTDKNYFFWKYENYLRLNEQPTATPMSYQDLSEKQNNKIKLTIEHIVAQGNSNEQSKVLKDTSGVFVGHKGKFEKEYLHSIGNLTIDPQSANSSKGKLDVKKKNSKYFVKAPYKCQNELDDFMENERWTKKSLDDRKNKLLNFAKVTWCDLSQFGISLDTNNSQIVENEDDIIDIIN